jgi:hypothetical protein
MPEDEAEYTLLTRCLLSDASQQIPDQSDYDIEAIDTALESVAPLLDLDMDAECPECGHVQLVHFDIQHYLLTALKQEQKQLNQEIHRLASVYKWSLNEILSLPRSQRRSLAVLIENDPMFKVGVL